MNRNVLEIIKEWSTHFFFFKSRSLKNHTLTDNESTKETENSDLYDKDFLNNTMEHSPIIGIDLGTTKSVVGTWINGKPVIIPDRNGHLSIPSEILIQGEIGHQEVFVGWDCKTKNKYQDNSFVVYAIKRMMGKTNFDREKWWYVYPQYTISYILAELKCMAEDFLKQEISDVVIAIPSHFDLNQRRAILEAAKIAGLNVISLLNEATASALNYFTKYPEEQTIAVIDIGGGTTDISIMTWGDNVCEVHSINGTADIGGIDFNNILYNCFLEKLNEKYNILPSHITKTIEVLIKDEIELTKKQNANTIHLPFLQINGQYLDQEFVINESKYNELLNALVDQIIYLIKETIKDYRVKSYLLLGGASKTFGIKERIINELNISPITGVDIETSVAIGATIKAASFYNEIETLIIDCLQDNYGIGLKDDLFEIFFYKNDTIPKTISKEFTTTETNQSSLSIKIYKGKKPLTSDNTFLGSIEINNLPPNPKGMTVIIVTFNVDANMDISVSATIKDNPKFDVKTILKSENSIPDELFNDMCRKVSVWSSKRKIREF